MIRWSSSPPRESDLAALLVACDQPWVESVDIDLADIGESEFCQAGYHGEQLVALALVEDGVALVRVAPAYQKMGVGKALAEAVEQPGVQQWVPTANSAAHELLKGRGWTVDYTDVQMRHPVATQPVEAPTGMIFRGFQGDSDLAAVDALICQAWGMTPPWADLRRRLIDVDGHDPALWVLAMDGSQLGGLAVGDRHGIVKQLAVAPACRNSGLGRRLLGALLWRFGEFGLQEATLGVHLNNSSGAHALYGRLGWREVSRYDKWFLGDDLRER